MDVSLNEFSKEVSRILNYNSLKSADFYLNALRNTSKYLSTNFCGVYFLDVLHLAKKALFYNDFEVKEDVDIFKKDILKELSVGSETTFVVDASRLFKNDVPFSLSKKVLISKLHIKTSFFGFFFFSGQEDYTKDEILATEALCSLYSYLIKDQELSSVFKMQLNALQDALSEKEEAYKMIEKQHKKMLEYDKAKNDFLANISHELRTPLNAILGFSQALDYKLFGPLNEKQEEYVKDIYTSGLHLLNMINELLDLAKIESKVTRLNCREICPEAAITEVINILAPLSGKKKIKLVFENNCQKTILADYQKFQQILYNLLSNAIKFTQKEGKIIVKTSCEKKKFILEVRDNGIGIEAKDHKKIFAKYVHLDNIYSRDQASTGLGLAITKELVKLHKGKISLLSEPNKGSTFRVELSGAVI